MNCNLKNKLIYNIQDVEIFIPILQGVVTLLITFIFVVVVVYVEEKHVK